MPTLLVLRHGKSDWDADWVVDADRPLAKRGRRAAKRIGHHLAEVGPRPTLALTSPATRARDTLRRVLRAAEIDCPTGIVDSFYGRGTAAVLDELRSLPTSPATEVVMVVGHEPTWSDLIALLTGTPLRFPTAALARLDIEGEWTQIAPLCATLAWLVLPRELKASER